MNPEAAAVQAREEALLISPVWPDAAGVGVAQRAHQWLEQLGAAGSVHLLVVQRIPQRPPPSAGFPLASARALLPTPDGKSYRLWALADRVASLCRGRAGAFGAAREWLFLTGAARRSLAAWYRGRRFARAVCFRLQVRDYARWFRAAGLVAAPRLELDCDDLESETRASIARLLATRGETGRAAQLRRQARQARRVEAELPRIFHRVHFAAEEDARAFAQQHPGAAVGVMPNLLPALPPPAPAASRHRVLFVGALGYFPNEDAVRFFADEVLAPLRRADARWTFAVAGRGAPVALQRWLGATRGVEFLGDVAALAPTYAGAGLVVAPVRGGGGTKIKVAEALAYGRPLIATAHAARGWALEEGRHFLRADSAEEWLRACRHLAADGDRAARLGAAGRAWAAQHTRAAIPRA